MTHENKFGMFIHWGLYSIPARGEWVRTNEKFKPEDYDRYIEYFEADLFDPVKWAKQAKAAGMKYMVLTAKHHDGWCSWPTKTTEHSIKKSPWKKGKGDVVKEFAEACKKHGIRVSSFAYPNNRRDERTDALMWKHFNYLRAGWGKAKKPLYFPLDKIEKQMVLGGGGIGTYYNTKVEDLKKLLDKAARTGSVIVFFSHNIAPGAERIHMPTEVLQELLEHAAKLNLCVAGFDELPNLKTTGN